MFTTSGLERRNFPIGNLSLILIELPGFTLKFYKYFHVEAIFDNKALLIHFPISSYVFDYPAAIKEESLDGARPSP